MRRRDADEFDDEEEEREDVDPRDLALFSGAETKCRHCGGMMHVDAEQCPHCRMYTSEEDAAAERGLRKRPLWFRVTAWICLITFTWWLLAIVLMWVWAWFQG